MNHEENSYIIKKKQQPERILISPIIEKGNNND